VLLGVLIDAENRAVVACNGRILASIPIPGNEDIAAGYITPELWKSAAAMAKKGPIILDYAAGTIAGLPYQNLEDWGMNYPDWKAVVPQNPDTVYQARLDPDLILAAALALGYQKDSVPSAECNGITLQFPRDYKSPVILHVNGTSTGVIMPMGDKDNTAGPGLRITTTPSTPSTTSDSDFQSLKAERDQLTARIDTLTKELTQSRHRITALETAAKHRQAYADNAAKTERLSRHSPEATPDSPASSSPLESSSLASCVSKSCVLSRNEPRNGIELRFPGKPDDATRDALKAHGFRWAPGQPDKPWIAKYTEERWVFATALSEGTTPTPIPQETEDPTTLTPENQQSTIINHQSEIKTPTPSAFDMF
jgi:hypothetical protein